MLGGAIKRIVELRSGSTYELLTTTREELDLLNTEATQDWISDNRPDAVIHCAAKVGGIMDNMTYPYEYISQNVYIQYNVINSAHRCGVKRLLNIGSTCVYPKLARQPLKETDLMTGRLEQTNEYYAIAKIAGLKLCQAITDQYKRQYLTVMPTNIFGRGDNYDLDSAHVLPALIRKVHEAKIRSTPDYTPPIQVWGSGRARREFIYVDEVADAILYLLKLDWKLIELVAPDAIINVGTSLDMEINEMARQVMAVVGLDTTIVNDRSKPDGMPRKCTDTTRMAELGWTSSMTFTDAVREAYKYYLSENIAR